MPREVASMLERLILGGSPDRRFHDDVRSCSSLFDYEPLARLTYLNRLRSAAFQAVYSSSECPELWYLAEPALTRKSPDEIRAIHAEHVGFCHIRFTRDPEGNYIRVPEKPPVQPKAVAPMRPGPPPRATKPPTAPRRVLKTVVTKTGVTHKKRG